MKPCEVKVVDYRTSNLLSIIKALQKVGAIVEVVQCASDIEKADRLVLPGVGAFGAAMRNIGALGIKDALVNYAASGKPMLGICLGMQLLFNVSFELGVNDGLSLIPGEIVAFPEDGLADQPIKIPHMGWNQVEIVKTSKLFEGMGNRQYAYFVHSFYARTSEERVVGSTKYGISFPSIVEQGNIFGIQFHPEKSQEFGLRILENFLGV